MAPRRTSDARQMSMDALFEAPPPQSQEPGGLDIDAALRETLSDILAETKVRTGGQLDRFAVAAEMSRSGGRDITKNMLDRYTAQSADEWRFPLSALPALIQATGDYRLLDLLAEACGCRVLRGEEAWVAEVGAIILQEQELKARKAHYTKLVPPDALARLTQELRRRTGGAE